MRLSERLKQLPSAVMIKMVRGYQWGIRPWLGQNCRFIPSCSEYTIEAIQKYGALKGGSKGFLRICRCNPFHPGGFDPP